MTKKRSRIFAVVFCVAILFTACAKRTTVNKTPETEESPDGYIASVNDVPEFDGKTPYVVIKNNEPDFTAENMTAVSYEKYCELDILGRCGAAVASVGKDIMPTEDRGSIGQVKPTGWHTVKYDIVDGKYLYNRCHLIGYQLTGENANERNLITGTRYLNIEGMLPFENMIADYVKESGNHVIYRVTPIFDGNNLLARGVQMEAKSVEDNGQGICFNVYAYNAQPGISINYATGESTFVGISTETSTEEKSITFVINISSKKFHNPECKSVKDIKEYNKKETSQSREELVNGGYSPCKTCNP